MNHYVVRPKADQDLEDQAFYYATQANAELGHRFLVAAHETFLLLVTQRIWDGILASGIPIWRLSAFSG